MARGLRLRRPRTWVCGALLYITWLLLGSGPARIGASRLADDPIRPVATAEMSSPAKVRLGERLFNDARLSGAKAVSCASCHDLNTGGDDGQTRATGIDGRPLDFNTPTVFNAALNFRLTWRGNFRTLEAQAEAVLLDRRLMNTTWERVIATLAADAGYKRDFSTAYRGGPSRARVLDALAVFQRSLVTPDARFDRYLRGDRTAITRDEERGYRLFTSYGCLACHQGVAVGGNLFQRFGIFEDPFARRVVSQADLGRFTATGNPADRHVFRVPSLRNVAVTAPYFHDGRTRTLDAAVREMARSQLGRRLTDPDADAIVKFLGTLTGTFRGRTLSDQRSSSP
jgi:cytochrome c peroxidase